MNTPIQHGENILIPVDSMPTGKKVTTKTLIVGHSETGHHHVLELPISGAVVYQDEKTDELYVELLEKAMLSHSKTHDKHDTLTVLPGIYKVRHKTEYNPITKLLQRVFD